MINKVFLLGNVGDTPELKYTQSGKTYTRFSLATTERVGRTEQGQKIEHTEWHRCIAWGKSAEIIAQWVTKGCKLHIEGRLHWSTYNDKNGIERESLDIQVDKFEIVTWGKKEKTTVTQTSKSSQPPPPGSGTTQPRNQAPPQQTTKKQDAYQPAELNLGGDEF